jgi:para-nitrobenzyl esterase
VYQYYFTWRTPVRDGKLRTPHAIEIPFAFDNVDLAKTYVGSGADRHPLATKISTAWAAFAHTGNPNCKELPKWTPYDSQQRAMMIFDNECRMMNNPHGEEQKLLHSISA